MPAPPTFPTARTSIGKDDDDMITTTTPTAMSAPAEELETLRHVNNHLRSALLSFRRQQQEQADNSSPDLSHLLRQIRRAAEYLRRSRTSSSAADPSKKEWLEYRSSLEELKEFLPRIQQRLLAKRSRLQRVRAHLAATSAWAQASKEIL